MFRGSHSVTIDGKGRFAIPAAYRQALIDACGGRMVVTKHPHGCLLVYPQDKFQQFEQELLSRGGLNSQVRRLQRFFIGNARDLEMDRQGRLLLPASLREFAGLGSKSVLAGMGHLFELWDEQTWTDQQSAVGEELAEQLDGGDLPEALQDLAL